MSEDRPPDLVWDPTAYFDNFNAAFEYERLTDELTKFIQEVHPDGDWHAEVRNFGWQHLDGHLDFDSGDGVTFLQKVLPDTECTFKIWLDRPGKKIIIDNAHHDAPCGGEIYVVTPQVET